MGLAPSFVSDRECVGDATKEAAPELRETTDTSGKGLPGEQVGAANEEFDVGDKVFIASFICFLMKVSR
jgi:hypothetical protein